MKVVCVRNFKSQGLQYELTFGKIYNAIESKFLLDDWTLVVNDKGNTELYSKEVFITLEEWRNNKINKIINV